MEERLIELEERLAYQSKLLADLDEVVLVFTQRIEKLESVVRELEQSPRGTEELEPHDTPPPHY